MMETERGATLTTPVSVETRLRRRSRLTALLRFIRYKPLGGVGLLIMIVFVLSAAFAPVIARDDPYEVRAPLRLKPPSSEHFLGTDSFGRDMFSRVIWGSRISLWVGFATVALSTMLGASIGLVSGYAGGRVDLLVQRLIDMMMAFPGLVLALTIMAVLGPSMNNVILALTVTGTPSTARVVRGSVLSVKENQYVEAARTVGCRGMRVALFHILPNVAAPIIIMSTAHLGGVILAEASLSFLGLGTPPPEPSWGSMLSGEGRRFMERAPWIGIYPGIAITLVVLGFNLLGDALRDVWDPRLRGAR